MSKKDTYIQSALNELLSFTQREDYKGWDPFDGLTSKIFKYSPFYRSRIFRLACIQFFKCCPINFRNLVFVEKTYNPKGAALFASGLILYNKNDQAKAILDRLKTMACAGWGGACWGYSFPWQARAFFVPTGKPNIVSTVFVANAFLDYFSENGEAEFLRIAQRASDFILKNLIIFQSRNKNCIGYIPGEQVRIHNVNMLGAALLARVYFYTNDSRYLEQGKKAMIYSMEAMDADFSWPYGELPHHRFIDSFHTGYNLVALKDWMDFSGDKIWLEELKKAYSYFLDTFWLDNGCPRYYHNSLYPIDTHCSAQGIVTCLKLRQLDDRSIPMATKIAKWAIDNMQHKSGYFYYQKTRWYTNKIPYMRWTQAWMFYALSLLNSMRSISNNG